MNAETNAAVVPGAEIPPVAPGHTGGPINASAKPAEVPSSAETAQRAVYLTGLCGLFAGVDERAG